MHSFQCVIEIPRGSKNKYEVDKQTGLLRLDRVLYSAVHYPANYGFVPQTWCDDEDPLDVLVLCQEAVVPLCIVRARPIGTIAMRDEKGQDDKLIAVAADDPEYETTMDVTDLAPHVARQLKQFLLDYKTLEHKEVDVDNLRSVDEARRVLREAIEAYKKKFAKR
ncbi:MAG: inorganic diphosphatase [Planctomycetota bacterium]|nr:inorganic diphosphatase [Planctomycetota bacterium]